MRDETNEQPSTDELTIAGPQSPAGVTPKEPPASAPRVLNDAQLALLTAVANRIVPTEGKHPGAGDLGVANTIHRTLAASRALLRLFSDGLVAIEMASARAVDDPSMGFTVLDAEQQDAVLRAVEEAHPGFFAALVDHVYRGYYADPRVYRAIGYDHRPPQPLGYELPLFDPTILARQRDRAPFWRRVDAE